MTPLLSLARALGTVTVENSRLTFSVGQPFFVIHIGAWNWARNVIDVEIVATSQQTILFRPVSELNGMQLRATTVRTYSLMTLFLSHHFLISRWVGSDDLWRRVIQVRVGQLRELCRPRGPLPCTFNRVSPLSLTSSAALRSTPSRPRQTPTV